MIIPYCVGRDYFYGKNKMKKLYLMAVYAILPASFLFAQASSDTVVSVKYTNAIGAGAGFTTGYGLSYRYIPGRIGFQANFAPYHDKQSDTYSAGVTFIYTLIESKTANLFLYEGNHYYYDSQMVYYTDSTKNIQTTDTSHITGRMTESYVNNGVGFGMEFIIVKRIGFNLMAGYAFYDNFRSINFTGETGLYYKF